MRSRNESEAVVLAVSKGLSAWATKRFSVPVCGVPAATRVHRVLRDAGFDQIGLITNVPAELDGMAPWSNVLAPDSFETLTAEVSAERPLLAIAADLPLLTSSTIHAFVKSFLAGKARRQIEASGTLAAVRSSPLARSLLASAAREFDDPQGPFGRGTWAAPAPEDTMRLTSARTFAAISAMIRQRVAETLGERGVVLLDAACTYIDDEVAVGPRTVIYPGTHLCGRSTVGADCVVGPDTWIESSAIEDGAIVQYSVVERARVRERAKIGPFAHLRPGSDVGAEARVGNFVEVKASRLGRGVKASHLSYLGDADVGEGSNIGAGTITCNFDGATKHRTVIEENAFIGSNTSLVAPVTIGQGAVVGAGSTITEDVPPGTLAIARARQVHKERRAVPPKEGKGE